VISFYKLEQIVKIWMESIKTDREVWYKTVGGGREDGYAQRYELSPPKEVRASDDDPRLVYIYAITDSTIKNVKEFKICLDNIHNPVFVINDGLIWRTTIDGLSCRTIPDHTSKGFSDDHISKLKNMIINADKTLEDYLKENPEFDMDGEHRITISKITFNDRGNINIDFYGDDRILNNKNKLYIGFKTVDEEDKETFFVFKVKEKEINCMFSYKFGDLVNIDMFHQAVYHAEFLGHWEPTEEEILHATFRWIVSDEIIKQAHKEACYT